VDNFLLAHVPEKIQKEGVSGWAMDLPRRGWPTPLCPKKQGSFRFFTKEKKLEDSPGFLFPGLIFARGKKESAWIDSGRGGKGDFPFPFGKGEKTVQGGRENRILRGGRMASTSV